MLLRIDPLRLYIYDLFEYIPNILYPVFLSSHFHSLKNFHSKVEIILETFLNATLEVYSYLIFIQYRFRRVRKISKSDYQLWDCKCEGG
jgi:hypothetical protein